MYDDERYDDPFTTDGLSEPPQEGRGRGCVFLGVTLLLVVSLIGSSFLAWFVLLRRERAAVTPTQSPRLAAQPAGRDKAGVMLQIFGEQRVIGGDHWQAQRPRRL